MHRTRARFVLLRSAFACPLTHLVSQGGKNRRRGKNENEDDKRELVFREDGQEYAQVTKMLGNGRLEAQCFDGQKRLAHIRGKMRKKASTCTLLIFWGYFNDHLFRSGLTRETSCYFRFVISKTTKQMSSSSTPLTKPEIASYHVIISSRSVADSTSTVKAYGELPESAKINETDTFPEEDGECTFEFGDEGEIDIDDI